MFYYYLAVLVAMSDDTSPTKADGPLMEGVEGKMDKQASMEKASRLA